ncbi:DoxX family protein [Streptomyces sp. NBC_00503]|uniref:DoxX family protein n=1 Tax=Streptomyces sp. NBC_00503 TaxID=2903659 RepID=UPI002E81BE75|nr:hypothetical protein [Streptomyces sp. NBC_00503]WUD79588.1 hypothetical protein OG490_02790 [Streptomyces sp. NBC_00503]
MTRPSTAAEPTPRTDPARTEPSRTDPARLGTLVRAAQAGDVIAMQELLAMPAPYVGRLADPPAPGDPQLAADIRDVLDRLTPEHRAVLTFLGGFRFPGTRLLRPALRPLGEQYGRWSCVGCAAASTSPEGPLTPALPLPSPPLPSPPLPSRSFRDPRMENPVKRYAFAALWAALLVQLIWSVGHRPDTFGITVMAVLGGFAALHGRWPWLAVPVRFLMAADFLLSVGDRFGAFGPPGTPGSPWGDFAHFVAYTRDVSSFLPTGLAPLLAVLATVAETALALSLLLGIRLRYTALGSAGLLFAFGVSMTLSLPAAEQFRYGVFLLCAGMLALSTTDRHAWSVDGLVSRRRARRGLPARLPVAAGTE